MFKAPTLAILSIVALAGIPGVASGRQVSAPSQAPAATLSRAEMEDFLQRARIVKQRGVSKGTTGTVRATLSDGSMTHDASIQTIDESRAVFQGTAGTEVNFRDATMLKNAMGEYLGENEINGLLARRDLIVKHFTDAGETAFYDARRFE